VLINLSTIELLGWFHIIASECRGSG